MRLTVLIATAGRPGLERTIQSVVSQRLDGDETMVVGATPYIRQMAERYGCRFVHCAPGQDWGHKERNFASPLAIGDYICHLDDDDCAAPCARAAIEHAALAHPGHPLMFRMEFPWGGKLWDKPLLRYGNVGTPMVVLPNQPEKFGHWASRYGGDFKFMASLKWAPEDIVWCEDVIALIRPAVEACV